MAGKVDALGKAFGALVALAILLVWLTQTERRREADWQLVHKADPRDMATGDFLRGEHVFYETWHIAAFGAHESGEWRVTGAGSIPAEVLAAHPDRLRIERSWHLELSPDAELFATLATRWASAYNQRMAELITHRHGPEAEAR